MTKEEAIKYLQQLYPNGGHCWLDEQRIEAIGMAIKALQEEPVSEEWIEELRTKLDSMSKEDFKKVFDKYAIDFNEEPVRKFLNTKSMIEAYKQRLISQANGMKNSPFIDMCLASYKHGINETLDTLNLSNVKETIKNWKESVSEDLENIVEEIAEPTILNAYGTKELARRLRNTVIYGTSVSEVLEKVSDKYSEDIESNYSNDMFDRGDIMEAFEAGAKWHEQQMMANAIDGEVLENYDGKVLEYDDSILDEKLSNCKVFDKVKIIVIKVD